MGNCIKTQLMGAVNNDNLHKFGILVVNVKATESSTYQKDFQIACNANVKLTAKNGGTFRTSVGGFAEDRTEYILTPSDGTVNIRVNNADYSIEIANSFAITYLRRVTGGGTPIFSISLNDVLCPDLTHLRFDSSASTGDIKNIKNAPKLQELNFSSCSGIYGDISYLSDATQLTDIQLLLTGISGSVDMLTDIPNLVSLNIENCLGVTGNFASLAKFKNLNYLYVDVTGVIGSVEDFAEEWVKNNPNVSNIIMVYRALRYFTFGGSKYTDETSNCYFKITSASKIAVYAGATSVENCPRVYCKGYTQQEAESEFSGKTIIIVDA